MDRSLNSAMGKAVVSSRENLTCAEDSGWTAYFEDFSDNMEDGSCFSLGGSSLVSDAASGAAWKLSHHNHAVSCSSSNKLSNFKKKRTKQILKDDPLEDTASSPVNSPKVGELNLNEMISRKKDDQLDGSMGKRFISGAYSELRTDDKHEIGYNGQNHGCTELNKRGLCLVPLSMLVNYFE